MVPIAAAHSALGATSWTAVPRLRKYMDRVAELHKAGVVKVPAVTLFPLAEAAKALGVSEGRHFKGKLILTMR